MSTITLGSAAADLLVTVQRGADKTLALRLSHDGEDVTADFGAVIVVDPDCPAPTEWVADLEDVDGEPALVWRLSDEDTSALPRGSTAARLEVVHAESLVESTIGVGRVVAQ